MNKASIEKTDQVVEHLCDLILGNKTSKEEKTAMTLALATLIEAKASDEKYSFGVDAKRFAAILKSSCDKD